MRKVIIVAAGLLWVGAQEANSRTFERQLLRIGREMSDAALGMRRNIAASQARQGGVRGWNPADALDESKVGVAARFVQIEPGEFEMGSPSDEEGRESDEVRHRVKLTKGFEMQATAVTQLQYFLVRGRNPSYFRKQMHCGSDNLKVIHGRALCVAHPVETVSWHDARKFIAELNRIQDKCVYRLPTEAEWEYAARGGMPSSFPFSFGFNDTDELDNHAWYSYNSYKSTHAVATKKANPWGLYDMHGNVREWVRDWYDGGYPARAVTDPTGPTRGSFNVLRGGDWGSSTRDLRSASRGYSRSEVRWRGAGFRLARTCR